MGFSKADKYARDISFNSSSRVYVFDITKCVLFDCNAVKNRKIAFQILKNLEPKYPNTKFSLEYISVRDLFDGMTNAIRYYSGGARLSEGHRSITNKIKDELIKMGFDGVQNKQSSNEVYFAIYHPEKLKLVEVIRSSEYSKQG